MLGADRNYVAIICYHSRQEAHEDTTNLQQKEDFIAVSGKENPSANHSHYKI